MKLENIFSSIKDTVMNAVNKSVGLQTEEVVGERESDVLVKEEVFLKSKAKNKTAQEWVNYCTSLVTSENKLDIAAKKLLWIHVFLFNNAVLFFRNTHNDQGENILTAHITPILPPIIAHRMEESAGGINASYQQCMYMAQEEIDNGNLPEVGWSYAVEYKNGYIMIYEEDGFMHCAYTKNKTYVVPYNLDIYN